MTVTISTTNPKRQPLAAIQTQVTSLQTAIGTNNASQSSNALLLKQKQEELVRGTLAHGILDAATVISQMGIDTSKFPLIAQYNSQASGPTSAGAAAALAQAERIRCIDYAMSIGKVSAASILSTMNSTEAG